MSKPLKNLTLHFNKKDNRLELVHPILGTVMIMDCEYVAQAKRCMKGWSELEVDSLLIKGYSVEHTHQFNGGENE